MKYAILLLALVLSSGCETFVTKTITLDPPEVLMAPPLELHTIKKKDDAEQR